MSSQDPKDTSYQRRSTTTTTPDRAAEEIKAKAGRAAEEVQSKTSKAVDTVQDRVSEVATEATGRTKSMLDSQKERAAGGLSDVARMLHKTGEQMEQDESQANVARYAHQAADRIDRLSGRLQDRSIDEILDDVEDYARRQPEVVIGGAFVLGFLASRFLKSSSARRSQGMTQRFEDTGSRAWSGYYLAGGWPQSTSRMGRTEASESMTQTGMGRPERTPSGSTGTMGSGGASATSRSMGTGESQPRSTYSTGTGMASQTSTSTGSRTTGTSSCQPTDTPGEASSGREEGSR